MFTAAIALLSITYTPFTVASAKALAHLDALKGGVYTIKVQDLAGPKFEPKDKPVESKVWFAGDKARVERYTQNPPGFAPARELWAYNVVLPGKVLHMLDGPGTGRQFIAGSLQPNAKGGFFANPLPHATSFSPFEFDGWQQRHPLTMRNYDSGNRKLTTAAVGGEDCIILEFDELTGVGGPVVHFRYAVCPVKDYAILESTVCQGDGSRTSCQARYARSGESKLWLPIEWEYRVVALQNQNTFGGQSNGQSVSIAYESTTPPTQGLTRIGMGIADGVKFLYDDNQQQTHVTMEFVGDSFRTVEARR